MLIDIEIPYRAFETDRILYILLACRNLCKSLNNNIKSRFLVSLRRFTRQSFCLVYHWTKIMLRSGLYELIHFLQLCP
jgi:hypothetical protein